MHGMPLAFLMGLVSDSRKLPGFGWLKPCVKPSDVVYIGLRDLDQDEKRTIKQLGIKAFTVSNKITFNFISALFYSLFQPNCCF